MINEVNEFLKNLQKLKIKVKSYCQDLSIPLEDRWKVFERVGAYLGEDNCYIVRFNSLPKEFIMYDGYMHAERHQTIDITQILEHIQEGIEEEIEEGESNGKYSKINLDKFKEEVLKKFLWSFDYDW